MSKRPSKSPKKPQSEIRLQSYLAKAGVASRRKSEDLITAGRVTVNGRPAELGSSVRPGEDRVALDGKPVEPQIIDWIALHKPKGYVTTRSDPRGRKTVYDLIPESLHHLFHVGRLDRDSIGLLLLTNDGDLANRLMHPRYETTKEYLVDLDRPLSDVDGQRLVDGIELEDGPAEAISVSRPRRVRDVYRVAVEMREGRNREVRRMFDHLGYEVKRLFRRRFAAITIGRLGPGEWRRLTPDEIRQLHAGEAASTNR